MDSIDLSNPYIIIIGGFALLFLIFLWNRKNTNKMRERGRRNFRKSYYDRKKEGKE